MSNYLQDLFEQLYKRLVSWLSNAPGGTVPLTTGVLGLAILAVGYYQFRGGPGSGIGGTGGTSTSSPHAPTAGNATTSPSNIRPTTSSARPAAGPSGISSHPPSSSPAAPLQRGAATQVPASQRPTTFNSPAAAASSNQKPGAPGKGVAAITPDDNPSSQAVFSQLSGVRRVSISVQGVLLQEWTAAGVQDSANANVQAVALAREIARATDLYLVAHVLDDVGEAVVTGALESAGLLGTGRGQVKPHRLLFCSTPEGKVAIVRQLEPELHFDGHAGTVEDLQRFVPLVHIQAPGTAPAAGASKSVGHATSLAAFFNI